MMITDINSAWEELRKRVEACTKCGLCQTRNNIVFGEGPVNSKCVIIGEAPGEEEDMSGRPFVGKAGQLLTKILENGGGIPRASVYITNTIKCRPPNNRNPNTDETDACREYWEAQLLLIQPSIIVTMGNIPTKALTNTQRGITTIRGVWQKWRGIDLLPMYHPSYLLRREGDLTVRKQTWDDVKSLKAKLAALK
ncbi:MAG: uracil-DNA glycosylase [Synergistaceae bacterium]|nr:uracil-DNA glycosylase [Synergistaceae bacterium]